MRHNVKGPKLNRDSQHRRSLYKNLVSALIKHGSIETTEVKAKSIKGLIDKLMTKAKKGGVHNRRMIDRVLNQSTLVNKLVDEMAPKTGKRTSGFTRIIKLNQRRGDDALMARVEFIDQMAEVKVVKEVEAAPKKAKAKTEAKPAKATTKPRTTVKPEANLKAKAVTTKAVNQPTRTQPKRSV
jgi:large subunit ribosomal protein L17